MTPARRSPGPRTRCCSRPARSVLADNTDLPGAVAAVAERYDGPVTAGTVLGGGATAASPGWPWPSSAARERHPAGPRPGAGRRDGWPRCARHPSRAGWRSARWPTTGWPARSWSPRSRRPAQTPDLLARCAGVPVVFEVRLRPLADPAGRRDGATPAVWSAVSTCWCTRRRCSSRCSPADPRRWRRCAAAGVSRALDGRRAAMSLDHRARRGRGLCGAARDCWCPPGPWPAGCRSPREAGRGRRRRPAGPPGALRRHRGPSGSRADGVRRVGPGRGAGWCGSDRRRCRCRSCCTWRRSGGARGRRLAHPAAADPRRRCRVPVPWSRCCCWPAALAATSTRWSTRARSRGRRRSRSGCSGVCSARHGLRRRAALRRARARAGLPRLG